MRAWLICCAARKAEALWVARPHSFARLGARINQSMGISSDSPVLADGRFSNRIGIVKIPSRFAQKEQMFVSLGAPVSHAFRHRVKFRPDNVLPQIPAVSAKRERDHPRHANQVLGLDANKMLLLGANRPRWHGAVRGDR